jgi:hypothetical protein
MLRLHNFSFTQGILGGALGVFVMGIWSCASQQETSTIKRRTSENEFPQAAINPERMNDATTNQPPGQEQNPTSGNSSSQPTPDKPVENPSPPKSPDISTTNSTQTTTSTDTQVENVAYDGFFYPLKMKECHEAGKVYDRATLDCHATQVLASTGGAGFYCNKTGIIAAFGKSETASQQVDAKLQNQWKIDQCGLETNGKKVVSFVCFTDKSQSCNANPICKDQKQLDTKETKFCLSKMTEN